jgi:signal transduction histidine kinase/CheY-like chemotaxis protein
VFELIKGQLPPPWIVAVGDRGGRYVARSERHGEFSGTMGRTDFLSLATADSGFFTSKNVDGADILAGYAHTRLGNWLVAVSIAQDVVEAPLRRAIWLFLGLGIAALVLSLLLALWLWSLVSRPIAAMANAGPALARGDVFPEITTPVSEIAALSRVISEASVALKERAAARETAEQSLKSLASTLEEKVKERTRALEDANAEIVAEMSRREEAEDQLRQLQKMDAIGQLTGGIAHDFNNMLAVIMSGLNLMKRRLSRGDTDIGKYLEAAMEGANRAAVLTARLLAFARQQALAPKPVDANKLLSGMSELLRRTLGPTIRIETLLAGGLWRTHADPSQLENAILNLAVNSRDAMPEGGRLTIETQNCHLDETYLTALAIPAGQYVMIAVTDTGAGMSPEVVSRAFEPFFSTKGVGKGTGLGLSQVYGFVKQSSGHVRIYSEVGQGTTVKIYLPRFLGAELADAGADALRALDLAHPGETVLVVEDDERVRRLTVDALNELGYGVTEAAGAAEAIRMLARNPGTDLLLTDIVMPDIDGRKLAEEALGRYPSLKVLYMTGFTRNAVVHNGVLDDGVNILQKPFTLEQLATKIRSLLDGK